MGYVRRPAAVKNSVGSEYAHNWSDFFRPESTNRMVALGPDVEYLVRRLGNGGDDAVDAAWSLHDNATFSETKRFI